MQDADSIYCPIIKDVPTTIFRGKGSFLFGDRNEKSLFQITCTASEAYIAFDASFHIFERFNDLTFEGKLEDGRICKGYVFGDYNQQNSLFVAKCSELIIGEFDTINTIEAVLMGIYFPHEFSFQYKDYKIDISKSSTSKELAKRTKSISGTISEGNSVTISGNKLNVDSINDLLRDMCLLLRPLTASEVYFGCLKCDNQTLIYHKKRMSGKLFGMRSNMLESTHQYPDYLSKGLQKLETIDAFDKMSITDIGHVLSTSAACGLLETGLMVLVAALERLGQKATPMSYNSNDASQFKNNLQKFKDFLKEQATIYYEENQNLFSETQKGAISKSISRISPWDTAFVKKIQAHLSKNGWVVDLDFDKVKELRDSLAHSGMIPQGFQKEEAITLRIQLEIFLFVHVLDLVGFDGRISSTKDGWAVFPRKDEFKKGKNE